MPIGLGKANLEVINEKLAETFRDFPAIAGAYLFGSILGYCRPDSDIDVGLILVPGFVRTEREGDFLVAELLERIPRIDARPPDVVLLNLQTIIFSFRVLSKGKLIYSSQFDTVTDFIEATSRRYAEVYPRYRQALQTIVGGINNAD